MLLNMYIVFYENQILEYEIRIQIKYIQIQINNLSQLIIINIVF